MIARFISGRLLPVLCTLLLFASSAYASKYAGAEIYVDYVGHGPKDLRYKVTLIVYHACSEGTPDLSIGPGATEDICYASNTCKPSIVTQSLKFRSCDTLLVSCPHSGNSCTDPASTIPGYYRAIYYDTVDISVYGQCTDWEFGWWSNGNYRNSAIKNLTLLKPATIDVRCGINNTGDYYNTSSPRYLMPPVFTYCIDQHNIVATSPYDPNNDSLYTINKNPWQASDCLQGGSILPSVGYALFPIDGSVSDPYNVDGYTGTTTVAPQTTGAFAIAMETDKYDADSKVNLGFCQRDVEIYVQPCTATPPVMDTIPQSLVGGTYDMSTHTISVCPGTELSFDIGATGPAGTVLTIHANNDIAAHGSGFFVSGYATEHLIGTLRWTPKGSDIGMHTIVFAVTDSTCTGGLGTLQSNYYTLTINVLPSVDAGPDLAYCGPGSIMPQLTVSGVSPYGNFRWSHPIPYGLGFADHLTDSFIANPFAHPDTSTTYVVTYTTASGIALACKNSDTVRVLVFPPEKHDGGPDQIICLNQTAILQPNFSKLDTFVWLPDPTLSDTTKRRPTVKPVNLGTNTYFIVITDVNQCKYNDSSRVIARDIAPDIFASVSPDTVCPGGSAQLFLNIEEQACGAGTGKCSGTAVDKNIDEGNPNIFVGNNNSDEAQDPTPYQLYYYTAGNRMQIIYTADELHKAGLSAGYINSIAFDVAKKVSTSIDSFKNFTIKMACTTDDHFLPSTRNSGYFVFGTYSFTTVYIGKMTGTVQGWNPYLFRTPYYWDGVSNLVVEICSSVKMMNNNAYNTPNGDNMYLVPTNNTQTIFTWDNFTCCSSGYADGCTWPNDADNNSAASSRPVTKFNFCQSLSNYSIQWAPTANLSNTTISNPVAGNLSNTTKYWVSVHANSSPGCVSTDTVYITVDTTTMVKAYAQDTILCRPGYTSLNAEARGRKPISNLSCGTINPQICATPDMVTIADGKKPQFANADYTPFKNSANKTQWIISNKILMNSGMNSGTIREMDLQTWGSNGDETFKNIEVRIGCTPKSSFVSPADTLSVRNMVLEYTSSLVTIPSTGILTIPFSAPYNWDTTQNLVIQICYGSTSSNFPQVYTATIPTTYNSMVQYYGYNAFYCSYLNNVPYTPVMYRSIPAVTFKYCPAPEGNFGYTWAPGLYLSDSNLQSPEVYVPHTTSYTVYTQGRNHCVVRDSVHIFVPVHHYSIYPKDTSVCDGTSVGLHIKGGFYYQWYQNGFKSASSLSCQTCSNPIASPHDTTTYQVVVTDSVYCGDTLSAKINIKPIPNVHVVTRDTTIDYGSNIQLAAIGANVFSWSPAATLSNPNIVNPLASPTEPTTYIVTGVATDGCAASDSVTININYRGRLYVPSAFSPNGDGKNDRFKVANLTFEKVLEFRVFNRWGQEVFNAEGNSGWDGTWKNVPQDMGTFEYLIRVGFPDGFIETFKGNVTLVR